MICLLHNKEWLKFLPLISAINLESLKPTCILQTNRMSALTMHMTCQINMSHSTNSHNHKYTIYAEIIASAYPVSDRTKRGV